MESVRKKPSRRKIVIIAAALTVIVIAAGFFTTDLIRAKRYGLPPVFCVPVIEYENGSTDYYGLGYKVWKDYHPFDETTTYYVGFWLVPKFCSI
jgi:hypothetical protein